MKAFRKFLVLCAAISAVVCVSAGFASADSFIHGTFKLPIEAHYKGVVLPAGEYNYSAEYRGAMTVVFVRAVDGAPGFFLAPATYSEARSSGADELVLTRLGAEAYVTSFALPELGVVLHYAMPSTAAETATTATKPSETMVATSK